MNQAKPDAENAQHAQYDTPWKIAVEQHFADFIGFYFPHVHQEIDWQVPVVFLDKELQAIAKQALVGTRHVDKLAKVHLRSGREDWICLHLEIQAARQSKFAERMYVYHYRIFDLYGKSLASLALLGDAAPGWKPDHFGYQHLGCRLDFSFPVVKLLQFSEQREALETDPNPFALLTLAYLQTRASRRDMQTRFALKCRLIRILLEREWAAQTIRNLFCVIDWMMHLPPVLEQKLNSFVTELEEQKKMEYVTSIERVRLGLARAEGIEEGMEQGLEQGIAKGVANTLTRLLTHRFGNLPSAVLEKINQASSRQLDIWFERGMSAASLEQVFQVS